MLADENQPPVPFTQHSSRAFDLPAVRLTPELTHGFDEQEHAAHARVAVREAAAVGVRRERAADAHLSVRDERPAFAALAEAERLRPSRGPSA